MIASGGKAVSLIKCTCGCVYQKDGYCRLEKAAAVSNVADTDGCPHFRSSGPVITDDALPSSEAAEQSQQSGTDGLSDSSGADQLNSGSLFPPQSL